MKYVTVMTTYHNIICVKSRFRGPRFKGILSFSPLDPKLLSIISKQLSNVFLLKVHSRKSTAIHDTLVTCYRYSMQ
jgi:hypothetical protein